jgi:hypothetical protein
MKRTTAIIVFVGFVVLVVGILVIRQLTAKNSLSMGLCDHFCPLLVSSDAIAQNLEQDRGDLVYDSLYILTRRKNPIAVDRAIVLLRVEDDYTWLNAAHYLGACGRKEAVPYLIKAFRHTAWRSDQESAEYLRNLTGEDFGVDFDKWKAWWEQTHPNSSVDWQSCLGFSPRLKK